MNKDRKYSTLLSTVNCGVAVKGQSMLFMMYVIYTKQHFLALAIALQTQLGEPQHSKLLTGLLST